jgi:hypothetical protein
MSDEQPIRVVTLTRGARVRVPELTAYGFQPIVLSLVDVALIPPFLPLVASVTPEIEISGVDLLSAPYPGYRLHLRNLSQKTVATFHVQAYRSGNKSMSAVKAGVHGEPAMPPGGDYTFDLNLTGARANGDGPVSPTPLDVIEIDSVVWADGTSTGPQVNGAAIAIPTDAGQRLMFERGLDVLRQALASPSNGAQLLAEVRQHLATLPIDSDRLPATQQAMRATRRLLLDDLNRFDKVQTVRPDAEAARLWIANAIRRYESWIKRLSPV